MTTIKKFIKIVNPKRGYYTHDDQSKDGLKFRTITQGANHATLLIKGESTKVDAYIARENAIAIPDAVMKAQYDTDIPVKIHKCPECGTAGAITIPEFDLVKAKALLD
jgi:ferredoxin-like protein FixX